MKKITTRSIIALLLVFSATSCVRNDIDLLNEKNIEDVVIPDDFSWSSLTSAQLTVIPADTYSSDYYYVFEVYGSNPVLDSKATLLAKGVAKAGKNFITVLNLPTSTDVIYVKQISPLKGETVQAVAVSGSSLTCSFLSAKVASASKAMPAIRSLRSTVKVASDPTPSGAVSLTSGSGDVYWTNNKDYVIKSGESFSGTVQLGNNSTLYVEGDYKMAGNKYFSMGSGSKLVIQSGGTFQSSSKSDFQFDANTVIKNYGDAKCTNDISITNNAVFYNYGTWDCVKFTATNTAEVHNEGTFTSNNSVEMTSQAKLYNTGKFDVKTFSTTNNTCTVSNTGDFDAQDVSLHSAPFSNEGSLTVAKTLQLASPCSLYNTGAIVTKDMVSNSGAKIYNNCHLLVEDEFNAAGTTVYLYNESLLKTSSLYSDGTTFEMDGGAILEAETAKFTTWRNYIKGGKSSYALARLKEITPSNSKSLSSNITFSGKSEIECTECTENPQYNTFYVVEGSDVRWALTGKATTDIAGSECNAGGHVGYTDPATPVVPEDPAFPIVVNLTTNYSFIMEDNWPLLGDYDLNDLVVDLNISYLQNADNKATQMMVTYKLRAVGAQKNIAAAFQLDKLTPAQVSSVGYATPVLTGQVFATEKGGLETGQSKAVIPMFDEAHSVLTNSASGMLNTVIGNTYYAPVSNTVTITFASPIDPSDISIANLNFFIVTDAISTTAKRTEIHLSGFEPTDKMDASLFGTGDDASTATSKYRSTRNLIWGLLIPSSFNYASELIDVTRAYPQFAGWCTSGGVENTFWYENPSPKTGYVYSH